MNYPIIEPEDITENILYCSKHKEYFSNNCSECMLDASDPNTISKAKADTRLELAKAVREMINPWRWAISVESERAKKEGFNTAVDKFLNLLDAKE